MSVTKPKYDRLLTFVSVYQAIKAEKILDGAGKRILAIPTPREIDMSCGQSLLFYAGEEQDVLTLLETNGILWAKLFSRNGELRLYEKLKECEG